MLVLSIVLKLPLIIIGLTLQNSQINSNLFLNDSSILTSCLIIFTILINPFFERFFSKQEKNQS